ncbi:hypothetical protein SADUNF_Sadunf16G0058000 [Salix dunnii]|uniref:CCHC-type domain-containing protein n=1 Tax=Salix dunnii TaxID=1413687 RepID=A0A835MFS3_9ROSI|nr:hypothetical protein SADUNF_Sadunf16G0058000 [Salix dunnii]
MVHAMKQMRKVDRASKEMQEDTEKGMEREQVEFTDNIVLRQLLRGPRYFDGPSHSSWEMCYNCGQHGHMVNVAKTKEREATVVDGPKALTVDCTVNSAGLTISCRGTAEMVRVESSAKTETEQERLDKENDIMVVMTQAPQPTNGVNSSVVIGVSSSSLEGNISFCRGFTETVPAETFMVNAMKQMRKVDRASKEMQEDTEKGMEREQVEFTDNIVLRQLLRGPRYFDCPSHSSWEMCSNCGQNGHMVCQCTMRKWKRQKLCYLCGSLNHVGKRCRKKFGRKCYEEFMKILVDMVYHTVYVLCDILSQNRYCSVCKGRGHRAKHCPVRDQERSSHGICLQCGTSGHDMFSCTTDYLPNDLKEIQCYVCRSFGHLCCVDFPDIDPREVYCYNCGESGHLGSSCGATGSAKACTINVEPKAILQEIEASKGRVDREENKGAVSFCLKD